MNLPVYLYVDSDNKLWYTHIDSKPKCLHYKQIDLPKKFPFQSDHYRLAGLPNNIQTITKLYEYTLAKNIGKVEVCSPQVYRIKKDSLTPDSLLTLHHTAAVNCYGGWRIVRNQEYAAFKLFPIAFTNDDERIEELIRAHPIWPELAFISGIDMKLCARVLATILDPRWFIDPLHPSRGSKLRSYLGLTPRSIRVFNDELGSDVYFDRFQYITEVVISNNRQGNNNFILKRAHGGVKDKDIGLLLLRQCQVFIDYIRLVWLSALGNPCQKESLFVPEYFFKHQTDATKFTEYTTRLRGAA